MTGTAQRLVAAVLLGLLVVAVGVAALLDLTRGGPAPREVTGTGGRVVIVGAPGLSWSDVDPNRTPVLWQLATDGAVGALVVRGTHPVTCPADGWLTLSAGQRAARDPDPAAPCSVADDPSGQGTLLPGWFDLVGTTAEQGLAATPGTLTAAVEAAGGCVGASGPLSAYGAVGTDGIVPPPDPGCGVQVVGLPPVTSPEAATDADEALGQWLTSWGPDTTVVVAGLADRDDAAALRVAVVAGPGVVSGTLTSAVTRQVGMVQTTDLTATALRLAGATVPTEVAGQPAVVLPGMPGGGDVADRVRTVQDLAEGSAASLRLAPGALPALVVLGSVVLVLALRAGRHRLVELVALALLAVPAATFLAGLVPWWRVGGPTAPATVLAYGVVLALTVAVQLALALGGPWRRDRYGPLAVLATLAVGVLAVEVVLGARLGLVSLLGLQPVTAGRFHGTGNVGTGISLTAAVLLGAVLAVWLRDRSVVGVLATTTPSVLVTVVTGAPSWGADLGGVPAAVVAGGVLALGAAGARITLVRVLVLGVLAAVTATGALLLDWLRPEADRTHLGRFVQSVLDGEGAQVVTRKLDRSLSMLVEYPASWVAVASLVLIAWGLRSPDSAPGRLLRPVHQDPALALAAPALLAGWVVGWAANDSGIATAGVGVAVATVAVLAAHARPPMTTDLTSPASRLAPRQAPVAPPGDSA